MSADINCVTLVGRLAREAERRATSGGGEVIVFAVAVNESRRKDGVWVEEAHFFDVSYFCGALGSGLLPYLTKGRQVALSGRLVQERWTDGGGANRQAVKIRADRIELLSEPKSAAPQSPRGGGEAYRPASPPASDFQRSVPDQPLLSGIPMSGGAFFDGDIPF